MYIIWNFDQLSAYYFVYQLFSLQYNIGNNDELENQSRRCSLNDAPSDNEAETTHVDEDRNSSPTSSSNELKIEEEHDIAAVVNGDKTIDQKNEEFKEKIISNRMSEENKENSLPVNRKLLLRGQSQVSLPVKFE